MASKHIFPILLDGAKEVVTGTASWSGETSLIQFDAAATFTVGDAELPGTLLTLINKGATTATVTFSTPLTNGIDVLTLNAASEGGTYMWNGSLWFPLADFNAAGIA